MALKRITPEKQVANYLQGQIEKMIGKVVTAMTYAGEKCLIEARDGGKYTDQTGNLRSSVGYAVLMDGKVVQQGGFLTTKQGAAGVKQGQELLQKLIRKFQKGIVLVVVAGMKYAAYVEAMGLNVITSSELMAEKLVPAMLKRLGFKRAA